MNRGELQLRFDEGNQQRYFPDRRAVLECVLRVSTQSPHQRFEVWGEGERVPMADGRDGGRRFELREVLDLGEEGVREKIIRELEVLREE